MMEVNRSCSVTVITGDSESLNPGSIPGRTSIFDSKYFFAEFAIFALRFDTREKH